MLKSLGINVLMFCANNKHLQPHGEQVQFKSSQRVAPPRWLHILSRQHDMEPEITLQFTFCPWDGAHSHTLGPLKQKAPHPSCWDCKDAQPQRMRTRTTTSWYTRLVKNAANGLVGSFGCVETNKLSRKHDASETQRKTWPALPLMPRSSGVWRQ